MLSAFPSRSTLPRPSDISVFTDGWRGDRFDLTLAGPADKPVWICGAQGPAPTLALALEQAGFDPARKTLAVLDVRVAPEDLGACAAQIAGAGLSVIILRIAGTQAPDLRGDLERALFQAGLRKHPDYYTLCGYVALNDAGQDFAGIYTPLPPGVAGLYPMSFLQARRELHMDMLREEGVRSDAHVIRYAFAAQRIGGQVPSGARRILDACCGYGYGAEILSQAHPGARICGIDIDPAAIAYAGAVYSGPGRSFECSDLLDYLRAQARDSVDAICFFEGMEHIENIAAVLTEMNRVLTLDGQLILSVPNHWVDETGHDPNPNHVMVYDWDRVRATLSTVLNVGSCHAQTGSRLNRDGKWFFAPRDFRSVAVHATDPGEAEWWVCTAHKRPVPGAEIGLLRPEPGFALEELILRIQSPEIRVVSFDVFDTLLVRPTLLPKDVFLLLQADLVAERGPLFSGFAQLRYEAEAEVRRLSITAGLGDILLSEIYARLADYLSLSLDDAQALMERELALEERLLTPRLAGKQVFEAALRAGKQVIIASDIYLTHDQLMRLLQTHGFAQAARVYVSGELRIQKRTGALFEMILDDLRRQGIRPDQVVHIGDNPQADVTQPAARGIGTELFTKAHSAYAGETAVWPNGPTLSVAADIDPGLRAVLGCTSTLAFDDPWRRFAPGTLFDHRPELYGALHLAPFLFFAMKDLLDQVAAREIGDVFFVTRDGHLPRAVFDRLAAAMDLPVRSHDLHLSRVLLQQLQAEDLVSVQRQMAMRLARGSGFGFGAYLSELIGSPVTEVLADADWPTRSFLQTEVTLQNLDTARAHLARLWPDLAPLVAAGRARSLAHLSRCFADRDPARCAIWDVGYFHTIAQALQASGITPGLSAHLVEIGHHPRRWSVQPGGLRGHSYLGTVNNRRDREVYDTSLHSVFLELLLSDPTSASRSLFTADGQPVVLAEDAVLRQANAGVISQIQNGVMTGVEAVLQAYPPALLRHLNCSPHQVLRFAFRRDILVELVRDHSLLFDNGKLVNAKSFLA